MAEIVIADRAARVRVCPELGAGLAEYVWGGAAVPIFRGGPSGTIDPFALGSNLLIPWSGRISDGGFTFAGRSHALAANVAGEPLPLHGNAFQCAWVPEERSETAVTLALTSEGPGPFRYAARVRYALIDGALRVTLEVTHLGTEALPYGIGLHPWFPRTPETRLRARADIAWQEDARHLPAASGPVARYPMWDFVRGARLPRAWINAWFTGWDGAAEISWPERDVTLAIDAAAPLSTYVVYSPGADADFFCFEPVSHPVDAHNLPGAPGLIVLGPGETIATLVSFSPRMDRARSA